MKYSTACPICLRSSINNFTFNINPTTNGIYDITCPNGHNFKINISTNHFQTLFENALNALADQYYIEALSSFASSYERFMEFFVQIVLKSRGVASQNIEKTWKNVARQSERQLGAFMFVYLKEFGIPPKLLKDKNITLRNNVVHKGYFPTMAECIKYGDNVLEVIRPIIKLLKDKKVYELELLKSLNSPEAIKSTEIRMRYYPYSLFAINRSFDKTEEKQVADFLINRYEEKNDEIHEEILKEVRLHVKEKLKPPKPIKNIVNHEITKVLLIEWYNYRYFKSGESDINVLTRSNGWRSEDVEQIINHLESIDWIQKYNINGKFTLTGIGSNESEKLKFIERDVANKHIAEREYLLKYLYKKQPNRINYKYSAMDLANDIVKDINDVGVFIADIQELGYVTHYYTLTEEGKKMLQN